MIQSQYFILDVFLYAFYITSFFIHVSFDLHSLTLCFIRVKFCLDVRFRWWVILLLYCRLRLLKCRRDVITAVLHSVGMKHRSLASASENACAWGGERFLFERAVVQGRWNYRLENVVFSLSFMCCYVLQYEQVWTCQELPALKGAENCCSRSVLDFMSCQ